MALSLPDPTFDAESTRRLYPTLPLFEGFPYLVTRVVPAMYHVIPLPAAASTAERQARQRRLDALVEAHRRKGGYILGDPTKGGREATADEVGRLAGAGPEGRPRGLERCPACGEWRGRCLDTSPTFVGKVMAVHCRCQNDNRCAACGESLYARKLNANYYNPGDGQIWHVPGFSGFRHRCPDRIRDRNDVHAREAG